MPSVDETAEQCTRPRELCENDHYELRYWKERWPYRDWSLPQLQQLRHADAGWLLTNLGFERDGDLGFQGFTGDVLEVGCGPLGFFELTTGVRVTAIDPLMQEYARELPFATIGARGSATYVHKALEDVRDTYRFVVCSNLLDGTADWLEFLEALVARVRPGGELLLTLETRPRPLLGHTQVFTASQIKRVLGWLGMETSCFREEKTPAHDGGARVFVRASRLNSKA